MLCKLFGHSWQPTLWNGYGMDVEQKCSCCNNYRYHKVKHLKGDFPHDIDWQQGKHPNR